MEDVKAQNNDENSENTSGTVPKKRGRPANPDKVKKPPSGRGRGRPAKDGSSSNVTKKKAASENGNNPNVGGPGRPPKDGKLKLAHAIESTGKGRGRPKKEKVIESNDEDEDLSEDNSKLVKKNKIKPQKKSGRPRKIAHSDDDEGSDDEKNDDEHRTVGRPATNAVNLNIVRTGRGQGRPKKADSGLKRGAEDANGVPKKRGRPPTGKGSSVASGKPRGRPKVIEKDETNSENEDNLINSNDDDEGHDVDDNSGDENTE